MFRPLIAHQRILSFQQVEQYGKDCGLVGSKTRNETSGFSFLACGSNYQSPQLSPNLKSHICLFNEELK